MLNWLDLLILLLLGLAAARGYRRGFIVEFCSFTALWVGVFVALRSSSKVGAYMEMAPERTVTAFLLTFILVIILVHLLARALTALIDLAMLGWANKMAGIGAAVLRSAFVWSIVLNLLLAYTEGRTPPAVAMQESTLAGPLRQFGPVLLPPLKESKWVRQAMEDLKEQAARWQGDL